MVDSLKIFDILKASSLPEDHARAVTLAIQKVESEIALDVKTVVDRRFNIFEEVIGGKFALMEARMAQTETRMMRWMIGFWLGQTALILAALKFFR